jgi:hypothetical protein
LLGIGHRNDSISDLAINQNVRDILLPLGFQRPDQLINRAAGVRPTVRHGSEQIRRQLGTQAGPKDARYKISRACVRDLLLKALVGGVVSFLFLEDDRLKPYVLAESALQAIDNARSPLSLRHHVCRRGDENRDLASRQIRHDSNP